MHPPSGRVLRLIPHCAEWAQAFSVEAARISAVIGSLLGAIEHVGSTAVPGLLAKPVIDIALAVESPEVADAVLSPIEQLGYAYRGQHGEDPAHRYYVLDEQGVRRFQLHVWIVPAQGWDEQLAFRDLLRSRADVVRAYAEEKLRIAALVEWNKAAYAEAKGPFIKQMLQKHGIERSPNPPLQPTSGAGGLR